MKKTKITEITEENKENVAPVKEIIEIDGKIEMSREGDFLVIRKK